MLMAVLVLGACSDEKIAVAEKPLEIEMSETDLVYYLEEITFRLIEANKEEAGSYKQKSFLDAAVAKSESTVQKLKEKYENDLPVIMDLEILAEYNKEVAQKSLSGDLEALTGGLIMVEIRVERIAEKHLGGVVPEMFKNMVTF